MSQRLLLLFALALVAVAVGTVVLSRASFTTASQTKVGAGADHVRSWLHLYSQTTDPAGTDGYATQRVPPGVASPCATGADETLALVMGGIKSGNTTYAFNRAFTVRTPLEFPDAAVTRVTITATYVADAATGKQPIRDVRFGTGAGGGNPLTIARHLSRQANVRLRAGGTGWVVGQTYRPHVLLTVTYTGFTTAYYVYDIPVAVTIVPW